MSTTYQQLEPVISALDERIKKTGDEISELKEDLSVSAEKFAATGEYAIPCFYEQGNLNGITGQPINANNAIRLQDFLPSGIYRVIPNGQRVYVYKFLADGTRDGSLQWGTTTEFTMIVPNERKVRIVVMNGKSTFTPSECEVVIMSPRYSVAANYFINYSLGKYVPFVLYLGNVSSTAANFDVSTYRMATPIQFYIPADLELHFDNTNYKVYAWNSTDGQAWTGRGWCENNIVLYAHNFYKLVIARASLSTDPLTENEINAIKETTYLEIPEEKLYEKISVLRETIGQSFLSGYYVAAEWERGNISGLTGAEDLTTNACRTKFLNGGGTYVINPNGMKTYIHVYDLNGTRTDGKNWGNTTVNTIDVDDEHMIRVVVMRLDNSALSPAEVTATVSVPVGRTGNSIVKNENCVFLCHQGYPYDGRSTNNNRLNGYIEAAKRGFDWGECDIKRTSDGAYVCCHDASFVDETSNQTIVIAEHTLEELKACNYYGTQIATLEEVMTVCKNYGLGLGLDQLALAWVDDIYDIARRLSMLDNIAWFVSVGATGLAEAILAKDDRATIMVLSSTATLAEHITFANSCCNGKNIVYAYPPYSQGTPTEFATAASTLNRDALFAIWIVDDPQTAKNYLPYVSAICSNVLSYNSLGYYLDA